MKDVENGDFECLSIHISHFQQAYDAIFFWDGKWVEDPASTFYSLRKMNAQDTSSMNFCLKEKQ